jgi:O-antigen ligase
VIQFYGATYHDVIIRNNKFHDHSGQGLFLSSVNDVYDLTLEAISNDSRLEIYTTNFNYFLDNPLFGIGIAGSADIINHYQSAHNIFLEIAAELGIVGLIPFVIMVILLIKKFFVNKDFLFGYLWLYSFIVIQFSGDIALNSLFWFFSAILMSAPIKKVTMPVIQ